MNRPPLLIQRIDRELLRLTLLGTGLATLILSLVVALLQRQAIVQQVLRQSQQSERDLLEQVTSGQSLEQVQRQIQVTAAADGLSLALVVNQHNVILAANDGALVGQPFSRQLLNPISDDAWKGLWPCLPANRGWLQRSHCQQPFGRWSGRGMAAGSYRWLSITRTPLALAGSTGLQSNGLVVLSIDVKQAIGHALKAALLTIGSGMVLLLVTSGGLVLVVRKRLLKQLVTLARIDKCTGLLNRDAWIEDIQPWLAAHQAREETVLLAVAGLDHFKEVNNSHGHAGGDQVLRQVSALLRNGLHEEEWLARLSGDQFALCLSGNGRQVERLQTLCTRLANQSWRAESDTPVTLTMSVGVASSAGPAGWDLNMLLAQADRNLRLAKQEGGNRVMYR